jgi:hypothetical protein
LWKCGSNLVQVAGDAFLPLYDTISSLPIKTLSN